MTSDNLSKCNVVYEVPLRSRDAGRIRRRPCRMIITLLAKESMWQTRQKFALKKKIN